MSPTTCNECGGSIEYVPAALSRMCVSCGIMCDPNQYVLVDDDPTEHDRGGMTWQPQPLVMSERRPVANELQRDIRDRRNRAIAHAFIKSVTAQMDCSGKCDHILALFDASMVKGNFRWGKRATSVIGACIMIAVREHGTSDTFKSVAAVLNLAPEKLASATAKILFLHGIRMKPSDPLSYLPAALRVVTDVLENPNVNLPTPLRTFLLTPSLNSVQSLATDLCYLTEVVSLTHNRAAPPVACALVIVALEGENGRAAPSLPKLSEVMSATFQVHPKTTVDRYVEIQQLIAQWKTDLPWLATEGNGKSAKRTAAHAQREEHAGLVKDVVLFREELWRKPDRMESAAGDKSTFTNNHQIPALTLDIPSDEDDGSDVEERLSGGLELAGSPDLAVGELSTTTRHRHDSPSDDRPAKRRRLPETSKSRKNAACLRPVYAQRTTRQQDREIRITTAASALLGGFTHYTHKGKSGGGGPSSLFDQRQVRKQVLTMGIRDATQNVKVPSRLEALSALVGEGNITDEQLFVDGEMEAYLRDDKEVDLMRSRWKEVELEDDSDDSNEPAEATATTSKRKRATPKVMDYGALEHALEGVGVDCPSGSEAAILPDTETETEHWDLEHLASFGDEDADDTLMSSYYTRHFESIASFDPFEEFEEV